MQIKGRGAIPPPTPTNDNPRIKQLIRDIVLEVLRASPPHLLYIRTGTLCDRDSQALHFEDSQEYQELVLSASAFDTLSQATSHIHGAVSTYSQYVTLSHRWGKLEPLLRDIEGRVIYDLDPSDGLSKLQSFCLASCQHGYLLAWSDTCCIDKESSA